MERDTQMGTSWFYTYKSARKPTCPVLAGKEALDGNDFLERSLFASDFSPKAKVALIKSKTLIKLFSKGSVHLLYVNIPDSF